jgi:hypothetical protein
MHAIAGNGEVCEKSVTARVLHCLLLQLNQTTQSPLNPATSVTGKRYQGQGHLPFKILLRLVER